MSFKILECPSCNSRNITDVDSTEKEREVIIANIKAKCDDCGHEFTYGSRTDFGEKRGVLY